MRRTNWRRRWDTPPPTGSGRRCCPAGHSLLVTAQAWRDLDGFCEDFFLFFEEADLTMRSARLGIPTTVCTGLLVEHSGGGATGATRDLARKSRVAYFHASRSCMIFFRRHYPRRLPVAVAARLPSPAQAPVGGAPGAPRSACPGAAS